MFVVREEYYLWGVRIPPLQLFHPRVGRKLAPHFSPGFRRPKWANHGKHFSTRCHHVWVLLYRQAQIWLFREEPLPLARHENQRELQSTSPFDCPLVIFSKRIVISLEHVLSIIRELKPRQQKMPLF